MTKTLVLLSENIEEIEKLKRWLINDSYRIKAASTLKINEQDLVADAGSLGLILLCATPSNLTSVLDIYETARKNNALVKVPILIITDMDTQKILAENIVLIGTRVLSSAVTEENLVNIVYQIIN